MFVNQLKKLKIYLRRKLTNRSRLCGTGTWTRLRLVDLRLMLRHRLAFFSCSIRYLIHGDRERNWDIQSPLECAMLFCLKMKMRSGLTKSFLKADARTQNLSTSSFAFRKANIGASYVFGNPCENLKTEKVSEYHTNHYKVCLISIINESETSVR